MWIPNENLRVPEQPEDTHSFQRKPIKHSEALQKSEDDHGAVKREGSSDLNS